MFYKISFWHKTGLCDLCIIRSKIRVRKFEKNHSSEYSFSSHKYSAMFYERIHSHFNTLTRGDILGRHKRIE